MAEEKKEKPSESKTQIFSCNVLWYVGRETRPTQIDAVRTTQGFRFGSSFLENPQ